PESWYEIRDGFGRTGCGTRWRHFWKRRSCRGDRTQVIRSGQTDETSEKDGAARPQSGASQSAARESGLQFDRAPADQNHAGKSESGSPNRRKNGYARQERLASRAANGFFDLAAQRRGRTPTRRNRSTLHRAPPPSFAHPERRPRQQR